MQLSSDDYSNFESLVREEHKQTELACAKYLETTSVTSMLLGQTPDKVIHIKQEKRNPFGRSDYMIVADLKSDVGNVERVIQFWELKAPQATWMEYDKSDERYRPSQDLVKAETQLLHYVYDARGNASLQERYGVVYSDKVRMGGIIIGRSGRFVKTQIEHEQDAAAHSFHIRNQTIYEPSRIRLVSWDRVLEYAKPR